MNGLVTEVGEIIPGIWNLNRGWNLQVPWSNLLTCKKHYHYRFFCCFPKWDFFRTKCFRKSKAQFSNIKVREMISLPTCPIMPCPNTPDSGRLDDATTLSNNNVVWKSKELLGWSLSLQFWKAKTTRKTSSRGESPHQNYIISICPTEARWKRVGFLNHHARCLS